jgi:hypothetical protein
MPMYLAILFFIDGNELEGLFRIQRWQKAMQNSSFNVRNHILKIFLTWLHKILILSIEECQWPGPYDHFGRCFLKGPVVNSIWWRISEKADSSVAKILKNFGKSRIFLAQRSQAPPLLDDFNVGQLLGGREMMKIMPLKWRRVLPSLSAGLACSK